MSCTPELSSKSATITPPPPVLIMQAATGQMLTQMLGVIARRKVADHIRDTGTTVNEIAEIVGLHPVALYRVMRALTNVGIFTELPTSRAFIHTEASQLLRSDHPQSMRHVCEYMAEPFHTQAWIHLEDAVETNNECFSAAHGVNVWQFFEKFPAADACFMNASLAMSKLTKDIIAHCYDFKSFPVICDVGGGHGELLAAALRSSPNSRGILLERESVVGGGKTGGGRDAVDAVLGDAKNRVTVVVGDMFETVPSGVDLFVLQHIVHGWNDERCKVVLGNCAKSLNKGGKVVLFEHVLQGPNCPDGAKMLDVEMLVMSSGGRERTLEDFAALFSASGLLFLGVKPLPGPVQAIEAQAI